MTFGFCATGFDVPDWNLLTEPTWSLELFPTPQNFFFFLILHNCISFAKYQNESATGILLKRLVHSWSKRSYICSIKGRNVPTSPPPQFLWIKNSYFLICYDRREKSIYMFSCNHKNIYCLTLGLQRKFSRKPLYCLVNCKINSPSALQQHKNCLGRVNESRYCQQ